MEIAVPLQNLSQMGLSKNFKDSLFFSPLNTLKTVLMSNLARYFLSTGLNYLSVLTCKCGSNIQQPGSMNDSACREYCTLVLLILILFLFKQQLISCVEILIWAGAEWEAVLTGATWALCWLNIHSPGTAHCLWDHFGFPCLTLQHSWGDKVGEDSADSSTHNPQTDKGVSEIRQTKPHSRTCSLKNRKMQPSSYWILVSWFCGFDSSFFISENSASHTEK